MKTMTMMMVFFCQFCATIPMIRLNVHMLLKCVPGMHAHSPLQSCTHTVVMLK